MDPVVQRDGQGQQQVLDAAHELLDRRRHALEAISAGRPVPGAEIVASGDDLGAWTIQDSRTWTHALSTRSITTADGLVRSMPNNRSLIDAGLTMSSVFDHQGTDAVARRLLLAEDDEAYYFSSAPVDLRIIDRERLLLHGIGHSILQLTGRAAVAAAYRYWNAVMDVATPCRLLVTDRDDLTARQLAVLDLLREGMTDARVAKVLGVSLRTVRAEAAEAMRMLEAGSRFAAGYRYASLRPDAP